MSKLFRTFIGIFGLVLSLQPSAFGNVTLKMDLEARIQDKLHSIIAPVDPAAQIIVNAKLKTIKTELPGVDTEVVNVLSSSKQDALDFEDVDSVYVTIVSREAELSKELKSNLESALDFPISKKHFEYKKMDEVTSNLILSRLKQQSGQGVADVLDRMNLDLRTFLIGLLALGVLSILLVSGFSLLAGKRNEKLIQQVTSHQGSSVERAPEFASIPAPVIQRSSEGAVQGAGLDRLHALSDQSVLALFSDCYWCKLDQYGAWLWKNFSTTQCEAILKNFTHGEEYAAYVSKLEPAAEAYHQHPAYLKAPAFSHLSQEDLFQSLKNNSGDYSKLTPMRLKDSPLSLLEKIHVMSEAKSSREKSLHISFPEVHSQKRVFESGFELGTLSSEDELSIFNDPSSIPSSFRRQVQSLVWFALLPLEVRQGFTDKLNAQDLAQAMVGPTVILESLLESLPEKKRNLVREYSQKVRPNRDSSAFRFLVKESLHQYEEKMEESDEKRAA